jgi:Raf kinase inhibitor-like YbhB/YbcL family protein
MRRVTSVVATAIFFVVSSSGVAFAQGNAQPAGGAPAGQGAQGGQGAGGRGGGAPAAPFRLMSPAFADGATLPAKYTCSAGQDAVSPPLRWMNAPNARTMLTFALIVHDMEPRPAKGIDDILHWMVWNIPAVAAGFPEGVSPATSDVPDGSHQTNGNPGQDGITGYRPPCPPQNVDLPHHYAFELFALDIRPDLPLTATRSDLLKAMDGHVVAHASIIAPFSR